MTVITRPVEPPKTLSMQAITELYLERPSYLITWSMGTWFCLAAELDDMSLRLLDVKEALAHINNAGYNALPHLEARLSAYNEFNRS